MIGYVVLGFVIGVACTAGAYCWLYWHWERVMDAIDGMY